MAKLSIRDLSLAGQRVFMRVDFNVPIEDGQVTEDTRIRETLPTVRYATGHGARLVLASHLGRPKGKRDPQYSLRPVASKVAELLGHHVEFADDCIGATTEERSRALTDGGILLLENLRFHPEEEKNDENFSRQLAALCDGLYVCDAFGSAHRAHASVVGITHFMKQAATGLLMERELSYLGKAISHPERPLAAVLGGAKVSDKIEVVRNLMRLADTVMIGGAMAYTFLKSQGLPVGRSLVEEEKLGLARELLEQTSTRNLQFLLPVDHVVSSSPEDTETQTVDIAATPGDKMGLDVGPKTSAQFREQVMKAKTILWNGPLGMFERPAFARGTLEMARAVAEATQRGATSIVGGGDSVAAVHRAGVAGKISHISTGGGASLEFLGGRKLPGVEALTDRK